MVRRGRFMTAQFTAIMLSLVMAFTIFPGIASAETGESADGTAAEAVTPDFVPGQLIVVTEQNTSKKQIRSIAKGVDGQVETMSAFGDDSKVALIEVEEGSELSVAAELECEDKVLFVQPNYVYEFDEDVPVEVESLSEPEADVDEPKAVADEPDPAVEESFVDGENLQKDAVVYPNDPLYDTSQKQYLASVEDGGQAGTINVKGAWDQLDNLNLDEENKVLVAVIDTGVHLTHEDLQGVIIEDKCTTFNNGVKMGFTEGDNSDDDYGHGTAVTGTIGANLNNGKGIAGVAGNRVKMIVVDPSMPDDLSVHSIDLARGIEYATDEGARLINISIGYYGRDYICESAIKEAWDRGTLCICSAGNENTSYIHSVGDYPYAINVMAHDWNGDSPKFTCYGSEKDVSAPGASITTTFRTNDDSYMTGDGTSFSAPVTAGAAALLLTADSDLTNREIKNLLYTSTGKESFSAKKEGQGFGRINIDTAMRNLLSEKTAPDKIVINKRSIKMYEGTDTGIEYAIYPGNTNNTDVTFESSNENVATVDEGGVVTAKAPGAARIKVKCGSLSAKCLVTVKEQPYKVIDRNPYCTKRTFTTDEIYDVVESTDDNNNPIDNHVYYYHQYRINLEKDETIRAILTAEKYSIRKDIAFLKIKDKDGNIVAFGREIIIDDNHRYTPVTFTAEQAGIYQIQVMLEKPSGYIGLKYELKLVSDKSFCEPEIKSITDDEVCFSWPEADGADYYIVKKYWDKDLTDLQHRETTKATEYTDSNNYYYNDMVNYYTVTAHVQTEAGGFLTGESLLVVKMQNPMTADGKTYNVKRKTLKKKSVKLSRDKVMTIENAEGTLTFAKASGNKKITIGKTTGKVKIKKGLKKGTYPVEVNVTAEGNDDYFPITKTVTFTIRVK